jgi:hypothetical protein
MGEIKYLFRSKWRCGNERDIKAPYRHSLIGQWEFVNNGKFENNLLHPVWNNLT